MRFKSQVIALCSIMGALVITLIAGYAIAPRDAEVRQAARRLLPGFDPHSVRRIEISGPGSGLRLEKSSGWKLILSGRVLPGSTQRVEAFLNAIAELPQGTLVTRDPETDGGALGIGVPGMRTVVLSGSSGETLCELKVGKAGPGGVYLQAGAGREIWRTGEDLSRYLATDSAFWADLRILPSGITAAMVMRVSLESRDGRVAWTAIRERNGQSALSWRLVGRAVPVQQSRLENLAGAVAELTGSDFLLESSAPQVAGHSLVTVTVSLTDDTNYVLYFGGRTGSGLYPCALDGGRNAYLVPGWQVNAIVVTEDSLTRAR